VLLVWLAPVLKLASLVASYAGAATLGDTPVEIAVGSGLPSCTASAPPSWPSALSTGFSPARPSTGARRCAAWTSR